MARVVASSPRAFRVGRERELAVAAGPALWTVFSWIGVALLLGAGAFSLYLIQLSSVATSGYELQRLETERLGWLARNEQLELELAKRRSLAWVEDQAVHRLGMVKVDRPTYVVVAEVATGNALTPTLSQRERERNTLTPALSQREREQYALTPSLSQREREQAAGDFEALRRWLLSALRPRP